MSAENEKDGQSINSPDVKDVVDGSPADRSQASDSTSEGKSAGETNADGARMDAAKAFFRAMYAGGDVAAEQYGMKVDAVRPKIDTSSCPNCEQLVGELEQVGAKAGEIEVLYKRMAADFDNYRKRTDREREDLVGLGVQRAIETLLPAIDDLDRAQSTFNNGSDASAVLESLKLISTRFNKCLEALGIKQMEPIGQPFDPRLHEPVQQIPSADIPEGAVAHDLRRGYCMGDKVIRPALVNVAVSASGEDKSSEASNEENMNNPDQ